MSENSEDYPFEIKQLDPEEHAEVFKYFGENVIDDFIRIGPNKYWLPIGVKDMAPKIYNMPLRPDDTWLLSFPKTGTTLTQELVWLVTNDFDFDRAMDIPLVRRFPFLELSMYFKSEKAQQLLKGSSPDDVAHPLFNSFEMVSEYPLARFIKSHVPLSLLPPVLLDSCRVVYVTRDPRDVAVSYFYHYKLFKFLGYTGDLKQHWNLFITDKLDSTPFFEHVREAWAKRNHPNLLFLFYEDMLNDMPSCVKRVAKFFGKTVSEEQLRRTCEHLAFDNFKKNKAVNYDFSKYIDELANKGYSFMRKGKAGGWREAFDEEMLQEADQWMADNLRDTDLRFSSQ